MITPIIINNKIFYCDKEVLELLNKLCDKIKLLEYNRDKALEFIYIECYDENRTKPIDDLNYYQIEEFVKILKEGDK